MKRTSQLKHFASRTTFALAAAVLLHSHPVALAQPHPEAPNRRPPPAGFDRRGDRPQPGFQPGLTLPLLERVLTEEQRESLHAAMASQRDQMRDLEGKIRAARQALMKASLAEDFDEAAVRAKALEVGKLDAELAVLRAKALSKLQPPLSDEQIERISNPPPPREMDGSPDGPRRPIPPRVPRDRFDRPVPPNPDSR